VPGSPASVVAAQAWQLNPLVDLHWQVVESACVAFESVSGETTVVDAFDAAALACLEEGPQSVDQITAALASDLQAEPSLALQEQVLGVVEEFLARGWVQRLES
jgi:PqqD family protein of HPr-rel-A system